MKEIIPILILGNILATYISWDLNKSSFWLPLHAILGWIYIFYVFAFCKD